MIDYIIHYLDPLNKKINGRYSSTGRALNCDFKGYRFKSYYLPFIDNLKNNFKLNSYIEYKIDSFLYMKLLNHNIKKSNFFKKNIYNIYIVIFKYINYINYLHNIVYWSYKYIYYIHIFNTVILQKDFKNNLIVLNYSSKQLILNINMNNGYTTIITVGKVLSSLNILKKSNKKTVKSLKLFSEYIYNFFIKFKKIFNKKKIFILKIKNTNKHLYIDIKLLNILYRILNIKHIIYSHKIPNSYFFFKKIKSIKRRLKKKLIKYENL